MIRIMHSNITLSIIILLALFTCSQRNENVYEINTAEIKEVHPKIRKWPSPSGFVEAETNPPSLRWPVAEKGNYAVRMSQDSLFENEVIQEEGLQWAIFNPHQKLKPGTWYWQYKADGGAWSERAAFVITEKTEEYVTPGISEVLDKIPESHPRVLVWAENREYFRKHAGKHKDSQLIIKEADRRLKNTLPDEKDAVPSFTGNNEYQTKKIAKDFSKRVGRRVLENIEPVCQAYLLTEDKKYMDAALHWAHTLSEWDPEGPTSTNDFGDSMIMYALAMVFDTFYHRISDDDKSRFLEAIRARSRHFYDEWVNYLEQRQVSNHVWQYNLYRFFMTALAVKDELPEADTWLHYIYEIWLAQSPILGGNDGGWVHGVSYFHINTVTLLDLPAMLQDITGFNYIRDPFYQNNLPWLIHAFPPQSTSDGFGDGAEGKYVPGKRILAYVDALGRLNQDPLASWYIEKSLDGNTEKIVQDDVFRWYRLRRGYKSPRPDALNNMKLRLSAVYPDVGMVYMHTNLNDPASNLMVAMRSSPYGSYSHMHADQNTFNIAYGGKRLFFNSGYKVSMADKHSVGYYKATQGHNGVLINGKGQAQSSAGWGWIPRFLHGDQISYAVGDASHGYHGKDKEGNHTIELKQFRRHLLMLRPGIIIIYDELENREKSTFSWLVHHYDAINIEEQRNLITAQNEVAKAHITLTGSQPLNYHLTNEFAIEPVDFRRKNKDNKDIYPDHWHFEATNKTESESMRFLAIIQVHPLNVEKIEISELAKGKYSVGDWQIEAELNVNEDARIVVKKVDDTAAFSSSGGLTLDGKNHAKTNAQNTTLIEIVDGEEIVKTTSDNIPASFYEAFANSN